jgi:hypothetical protein
VRTPAADVPGGGRERAVLAPEGRRGTPCVPTGLSTLGVDVVRLLCRNGKVLGTTDSARAG